MQLVLLALWATSQSSLAEGYRILCVFPVPTASHNILGKGIVDALLDAGHDVWWATPFPEKAKPRDNMTILDVSATQVVFKNLNTSDAASMVSVRRGSTIASIAASAADIRRAMTLDFQAVVTEWFMSDLPAGYAAVLQAPWIMLSSTAPHPILESLVDDVTSTPLIPTFHNDAPLPMTFWQRIANSLLVGGMKIITCGLRVYESSSGQYQDTFGPMAAARGVTLPPLSEVYKNISILLVNTHPIVAPAQSFPPNVVDIGGYHIGEDVVLPEDLQQLLDSSTQGFVYFSMGSVIKTSQLSSALKAELAQVFGKLPYTVLWRSDEELSGLPGNVYVRKWFPQGGVLAHPNIKLFITHCGLLSMIEAVHYGVPLLAVPVFGDQPANAARAAAAGFAVTAPFHGGMAREVSRALAEMVNNDSYYKTAKHLSKLFHNRPAPPSKLIAHYVELAIESKGAFHLRSAARHYPWYQRARIDQLLCFVVFCYSLYVAGRITLRGLTAAGKRKKE